MEAGVSWSVSTTILATAIILAVYLEFEKTYASTRVIALLAFITATTIVSRQVLHGVAVSPVFFFVVLTGYVFGPVNGFVLGATTMLVSNFFVGGHGPWTPFQMIGMGLVGFSAHILPKPGNMKLRIFVLSAYGVFASFLYSAVTDVFWWLAFTSQRTLATYLAVSSAGVIFSIARAIGNVIMFGFFGPAFIKIFERFRKRFFIEYLD
ncbi:MAG: ECF transporter S component [Candidatus Altiarchaeota archaeon]